MTTEFPGNTPAEVVQAEVTSWYLTWADEYDTIWPRLDEIRQVWGQLDHSQKVGLLKGSYVFTVFTQLTETHLAEAAYRELLSSATIIEARTIDMGLPGAPPGKQNQLTAWILDSFAMDGVWDSAVALIDAGDATSAQDYLIDNVKGVSAAKSGFVLANIGITHKMCIDSNLRGLFDLKKKDIPDKAPQYDDLCHHVRSFFPKLERDLAPYHLQWVIFDYARQHVITNGEVRVSGSVEGSPKPANHDVWFGVAIQNPGRITAKMESLTETAHAVRRVLADHPDYATAFGGLPYRDMTHFAYHEEYDDIPALVEEAHELVAGDTSDFPPGEVAAIEGDIQRAVEQRTSTRAGDIEVEIEEEMASLVPDGGGESVEWKGMTLPKSVGVWTLEPPTDDRASWEWPGGDGSIKVNVSESAEEPGTWGVGVVDFDTLSKERITGPRVPLDGAVGGAIEFMNTHPDGFDPSTGAD